MTKLKCPKCGAGPSKLTYTACHVTAIIFHDVRVKGDTLFIKEHGDCSENQLVDPVLQCQRCEHEFAVPDGLKIEKVEAY